MTTPYENDTDMAYEAEIPDSQEEPESCSSLSVCSGAEENPGGTQKSRQEPLDSAESGAPDDSSSFHTEDTVIIRGGTCLQKRRYTLHRDGININGRLAIEAPRYRDWADMEDQPTQSTQPFLDPRRYGHNSSMSYVDQSDVICILHPNSKMACGLVDNVAKVSPQHILNNQGLSRNLDDDLQYDGIEETDLASPSAGSGDGGSAHDIALRLSSKVKDIIMGFRFGRNPEKCDIVIDTNTEPRGVSNTHFRIYLNDEGIIMLEDTSMNGTLVDNELLRGRGSGLPQRHILTQGTVIELRSRIHAETLKFVVSVPSRDHPKCNWNAKLLHYIEHRNEIVSNERARAKFLIGGPDSEASTTAGLTTQELVPRVITPTAGTRDPMLTAGSERYNFGMRWSGGDKYNVVAYVGRGAFANVYKLATKREGEVFAVKELEKRRFIKDGILDVKFNNELDIMKKLDHPHIVKFFDYEERHHHLYIIMEFVPCGDLSKYSSVCRYMKEDLGQSVTRQMCHALRYLHNCGITHRDIKPDNILVSCNDPFVVKLSDFGLSKVVVEGTLLKTFCGTLLYCAPEVYPDYDRYKRGYSLKRPRHPEIPRISLPYSSAVDVWSLAAVVFQLLCDKPPYKGSADNKGAEMIEDIMTNELNITPLKEQRISLAGISFFKETLHRDPTLRLSAVKCLRHSWLKEVPDVIEFTVELDERPEGLDDIPEEQEQETEEQLDASQLSLNDTKDAQESEVMDTDIETYEDEVSEVDEMDLSRLSKRAKTRQNQTGSHRAITYPTLPNTDLGPVMPFGQPQAGRLFGEIDASDLQSSGALGFVGQVSAGPSRDSEGSYDPTSDIINTHLTTGELLPHNLQYPSALPSPYVHHPVGSAPSLLGAEAQIGQMNMASPESALSAPATPKTPKTPKSRQLSPTTSSMTGSKRSSQALQATDNEVTPKRAKKHSPSRLSSNVTTERRPVISSTALETKSISTASNALSHDSTNASHKKSSPSTTKNSSGVYDVKDVAAESIHATRKSPRNSKHSGSAKPNPKAYKSSKSGSLSHQQIHDGYAGFVAASNSADRAHFPNPLTNSTTSDTTKDINPTRTGLAGKTTPTETTPDRVMEQKTGSQTRAAITVDGFVKPAPRFGRLVPLAGSAYKTPINLESRMTTFGRDPSLDHVYPDNLDTRMPKRAVDILFWRPGIEREIDAGADWTTLEDVRAIIFTRCSQFIWVNDVKLTSRENDGWHYGVLKQGDIITVFDDPTGFLKLRCDFYHGTSQAVRAPGDVFVVEKETEKFKQAQSAENSPAGSATGSAAS